jgi:CheY-like chemotaxis protein
MSPSLAGAIAAASVLVTSMAPGPVAWHCRHRPSTGDASGHIRIPASRYESERQAASTIPATCNVSAACAWDHAEVPFRCLIVDDNAHFLEAAASLLQREGVTVVGGASSIADALQQARELSPDVILVDIVLGSESGFDLARRLAEMDAHGPTVILISTHAEADFADLIEDAPAAGFMPKSQLSAGTIQRLLEAS